MKHLPCNAGAPACRFNERPHSLEATAPALSIVRFCVGRTGPVIEVSA
ncbi:hypothetical protein M2367_003966 [Aeromonas sp. BIGb0445]|jgi:hypothetical protein|nr:hypothetical protein [Aeromonas sp. BIGb0445]